MFEGIVIVVIAVAEFVGIVHQNHVDARQEKPAPAQSWDQETLQSEATTIQCADRSYVYGVRNGHLGLCQ